MFHQISSILEQSNFVFIFFFRIANSPKRCIESGVQSVAQAGWLRFLLLCLPGSERKISANLRYYCLIQSMYSIFDATCVPFYFILTAQHWGTLASSLCIPENCKEQKQSWQNSKGGKKSKQMDTYHERAAGLHFILVRLSSVKEHKGLGNFLRWGEYISN